MAKYLVIVESPAKVKTFKKFLGKNYEVMASNGLVRDLPKSQLGFSPENDFEPKYITIRGKGEILAKLRKEVKKGLRELEHTLNNTSRTSDGNLKFASGVEDDPESFIGKGWDLDV